MSDTHKDALGELAERLRTMFSDKGHSQVIDGHRWWSLSLQNERDIATAADALERQGWVSVEERLPESREMVLAAYMKHGKAVVTAATQYSGHWDDEIDGNGDLRVTHWMPLPQPPEEKR